MYNLFIFCILIDMKNILKICQNCNKEFLADKKEINRGNAKFCSLSCSGISNSIKRNNNNNICICKHCGREFNSSTLTSKYCSTSCKSKNYRLKKKSGNLFDRQLELEIRKYPCEICNWMEAHRDAHHILPVSENGKSTIDNLISLCPNHHRLADLKLLSQDYLFEIIKLRTISSSLKLLLSKIKAKEQEAKSGN